MTQIGFYAAQFGLGMAFLAAVVHHVVALDFKPLAAFGLPILLIYFAFASLQYSRSKSVGKGLGQRRSLHAAERAVQATVWHLLGFVLGTSLYVLVTHVGLTFDPESPSPWLLVFAAPYAMMQIGLMLFIRGLWTITPDFLRRVGSAELARRVRQ